MAERSMSNALARTLGECPQMAVSKEEDLASKKRALASPEVDAFIKEGAERSPSERFVATASTRGTARGAQRVREPDEQRRARHAAGPRQPGADRRASQARLLIPTGDRRLVACL